MTDRAKRFKENPIILPQHIRPSLEGLEVPCVLNPGAFTFQGKTWLLLRVAERPVAREEQVATIVLDPATENGVRLLTFDRNDPDVDTTDPRGITYQGCTYLSTLSHLRLASSEDGIHFHIASTPTLLGAGPLEAYGMEDCRVTEIDGVFYLTYTAVSHVGYGVGLISTEDWQAFRRHGMIFPPNNKDCALFPEEVAGQYIALHRPSLPGQGTNHIWLSRSPDLIHWGEHICLAQTRPGMWDAQRIGAGGAPIRTDEGWLEIYHGADEQNRYCLGALLLDLHNPAIVLARSQEPLMEPLAEYEQNGFFGNVVFTNGFVLHQDQVTIYYGASDQYIGGASFSLQEILASLR